VRLLNPILVCNRHNYIQAIGLYVLVSVCVSTRFRSRDAGQIFTKLDMNFMPLVINQAEGMLFIIKVRMIEIA
jgi:hypothetical protein